jgi:hypothetical protein
MAMACLRLVTFFPDPPLRNVPSFISCTARSTFLPLDLEYFLGIADDALLACGYLDPPRGASVPAWLAGRKPGKNQQNNRRSFVAAML